MQKITPHLWFDNQAIEAADFYTSIFPDSEIIFKTQIKDTPSGDCDLVGFKIMNYEFKAISAGPHFQFTPSISIMVNFDPAQDEEATQKIDEIWEKLSENGKVLMPLGQYPFSSRYGWIQDKFGLSWQLILTDPEGEIRPQILPALLFVTDTCEQAEEATDFYISTFQNSKRGMLSRYPAGMEPNKEGSIMFTDFTLEGQWFVAMDGSSQMHDFKFNEAISFIVNCEDQKEIDYFWEKLSAKPESEQCGWLKDQFGLSWQIIPQNMDQLTNTPEKVQKMLKMKKIVINELEQ